LWKNGFLEIRVTKQAYSPTDRRFLPDFMSSAPARIAAMTGRAATSARIVRGVLDRLTLIKPRFGGVGGADMRDPRFPPTCFLKQVAIPSDRLRTWNRQPQGRLAAKWSTSYRLQVVDEGFVQGSRVSPAPLEWGHSGAGRHSPTASSRASLL